MKSLSENNTEGKSFIDMVCCFDHEEIGSTSQQGARSKFVSNVCERLFEKLNGGLVSKEKFDIAIRKSFIISADMAHAVHPNYASKHQS